MHHDARLIDTHQFKLGRDDVPVFALRVGGEGWALIDGGLAADAELLLGQLARLVGDLARVRWWFVTHAHYDHCGSLPWLLGRLPRVRVFGAAGLAARFASRGAAAVRAELDRRAAALRGVDLEALRGRMGAPVALADVQVQIVVDGDVVALDDASVVGCHASPGHAPEHMAYSFGGSLFVGDALGEFAAPRLECPLAFADVEAYERSIGRLERLAPTLVAFGHDEVITSARCRSIFAEAREALDAFRGAATRAHLEGETPAAFAATCHLRHGARSRSFLPSDLHVESMRRMAQLVTAGA